MSTPRTYGPLHLTPQMVATTVQDGYNSGVNWSTTLEVMGISAPTAITALHQAGWSSNRVNQFARNPSLVQKIFAQLGQSTIVPPLGAVGTALAGTEGATAGATGAAATSGAASGAASATANAAKAASALDIGATVAGIWAALTTPKMWLRVLEFVGGAVLIFWALKSLTGTQVPVIKLAKAAV